jgi:hypothetical protein
MVLDVLVGIGRQTELSLLIDYFWCLVFVIEFLSSSSPSLSLIVARAFVLGRKQEKVRRHGAYRISLSLVIVNG